MKNLKGLASSQFLLHLQSYSFPLIQSMSSFSSSSGNQECESRSNPNPKWIYDVYLSFCGKDTASFASHLYTALSTNAGTFVFWDDDRLRSGDQMITPSVLQAIGGSRISIIVFSRNYADSKRCLQELEKVMECRRTIGQMVLPLFYDVHPSDVRRQRGVFGEAFKDLIHRILTEEMWEEEDRFVSWAAALSEASKISGFIVMDSRKENEDIKNVVEHVTHVLDKRDLFVAEHPVGVESRVQDVSQRLNSQQSEYPLLLGIWGMGGIGKTTIAKAIYNQIGHNFEAKSFLLNVREVWEQYNGQVSLQERLLFDIYKTTKMKILTIESGKMILKERLQHKRVLLILDNVNKLEQLKALCGSREWFGSGSIIIITTRDRRLLKGHGVDHEYRVTEMDQSESLELFSWHAFKQASPKEDFVELSRELVTYFGGLPFALEVLGSNLFERVTSEWESILQKLKRIPNQEVQKILKISFDDLNDKEKKIFLDIACFFIGMDQNEVIHTLTRSGQFAALQIRLQISVLEDKSLITVDKNDKLGMHVLLRDMGREIIAKESRIKPEPRMFDVFLSFRGDDTRASFTSHLYVSLQNEGIYVFRDNDEIQRGDQISVSLLQAIGRSRICVIVLSKNYANSRWCMQELENIMESRRTMGLVVVPVFYGIDPSDVRHQTGKFGEAFEDLITRISVDEYKVRTWRIALLEVGGIAGFVVIDSRNENADIKNIVKHVTRLLDRTELFIAEYPVGVESRVQVVVKLFNSQQSKDVLLLGIWGMGGIGKTTIAKAIYNEIGSNFEGKSFLPNIREVWEQNTNRVSLQQLVLHDVYKTMIVKVHNIESGKNILKERLARKKVLLVLDDVNKLDQLNALCGSREWFGPGSRIIITTRDKHLLRLRRVDHIYRVEEMNESESLELFSWHAFKRGSPREDFARHSRNVVAYSGRLPLALEVLGSYLFDRGITEWENVLEKLKRIPNDEIQRKLKISFDGLSDDTQKEIFLDIACFFIGMDRNDVIQILNGCGFFAENGINVLIERSLVTVDNKNKLGMHDLLRDMGREIIREKSPNEPEERSRLWLHEEVLDVLLKHKGTKAVKGLALKLLRKNLVRLNTKAFEKMNRLRLLQFAGVQLDGEFKHLVGDLRWLCWHGFPLTCMPTEFHLGSLVVIELKYSNLKQWKKSQMLENLKILNLSHSKYLTKTPDFSYLPNLEKLVLKDCPSLSAVSHTIGYLNKLLLINLKDCTGLRNLPRSIYKLKSLETLILSGCSMIDKFEEDLELMESLTTLIADNTAITKVPFSIIRSKSIGYISLCGIKGFSRDVFPYLIWSWMSPTNNLSSQIQTSADVSSLLSLDVIPNSSSYGLSSTFKDLPKLRSLCVKCGSELQLTQDIVRILDILNATICEILEAGPTTSQISDMNISSLLDSSSQVHISRSRNSSKSLLIQMGTKCQVPNILKEGVLQTTDGPGGEFLIAGDNYSDWLTFNCNGSSVIFEVPDMNGRNLKSMMLCIVFSSSSDNIISEDCQNVLIINYTKTTIQVYKRNTLTSFEDEEWQSIRSNLEPGNKVGVVVVFGQGFIVKNTAVYLLYDEPINEEMAHCHVVDRDAIVSGGDNMPSDKNRFRRLFTLPSLVRAILISRPIWFSLVGILVWITCHHSNKQRSRNLVTRYVVDCIKKLVTFKKANETGSVANSNRVKLRNKVLLNH